MSDSLPNLQVRILGLRAVRGQEYAQYPVEAELDDGSRFRGMLDPVALDRLPNPSDTEPYGLALFDALFRGGIRDAYNQAVGRCSSVGAGKVRLRLWIEDAAAELQAIPWERLHSELDGRMRPLVAGDHASYFSRYLGLQRPETPPFDLSSGPLRILFAISNPKTLPPGLRNTHVDDEVNAILDALDDLEQQRQIAVTFLTGCTPLTVSVAERLDAYVGLRDGCRIEPGATTFERFGNLLPQHELVHFLGHGRFLRENPTGPGTAALYFEDEGCSYVRVLDQQIVQLLQTIDPKPYLFFLAACESAVTQATEEHPYVGLAPQLIAAGIPAVVAMQDVVTMDGARQLTARFYRGLLDHGVLDRAMHQARTALLSAGDDSENREWATPVLLMRLQQGQLFTGAAHEILERMLRSPEMRLFGSKSYIDLPLEVLYLTGQQVLTNLDRLPPDTVASVDLMAAVADVFRPKPDTKQKTLVAIVGSPGTNKTTQTKRIAWRRIERSLGRVSQGVRYEESALPTVVPVYVSLKRYDKSGSGQLDPLEMLILDSLRQHWPDLGELPDKRPVLRFLFDDDDKLTEQDRSRILTGLLALMERYPEHQYVLAATPSAYEWERIAKEVDLHILLIQPLDRRKIRHILEVRRRAGHEAVSCLLDSFYQSDLFDIARNPSFLVRLVQGVRRGRCPASRIEAVWGILEDELLDLAPGHDTQTQVEKTLYRLAWEMKRAGSWSWPLEGVFAVMAEVRGRRGYDLESLYDELLGHGILAWAGADTIRFNYPLIQDYCCARAIRRMAERDRVVRDLVATLGVQEWLRWWEEVLVFLSGLMAEEPSGLRRLFEALVYGLDPLRGDQVFLAARCLLEARRLLEERQRSALPVDELQSLLDEMIPHVVNALRWRIDVETNPVREQRAQAAHLLGALAGPSAAADLTRLAIGRPRRGAGRRVEYKHEISGVRLAAATELSRLNPQELCKALKDAGPALGQQIPEWEQNPRQLIAKVVCMVRAWQRRDAKALRARFEDEGESLRAIAAFALGDLQSLNALAAIENSSMTTDIQPDEAAPDHRSTARSLLSVLERAFLDPDKPESVGWALAEALSLMDTLTIIKIIRPALEQKERKLQQEWYLAYLIGALRLPPGRFPEGRIFLRECVSPKKELKLVGIAVDALAALRDPEDEILLKDFAMVKDDQSSAPYLRVARRKAIEALRNVGTLDTVRELRKSNVDRTPDLRDAFYETSRAIYWRSNAPSE